MLRLGIISLILLCFGCQTGRIQCPKAKGPKLLKSGKNYPSYSDHFPAIIEPEEIVAERQKGANDSDTRFIKSVSIEEWDCPQPGNRKYLPRNVKVNIRRNARLIEEDRKRNALDSLLRE